MKNLPNEENILLHMDYKEVKNPKEHVDFTLFKPKKLSENKYECIYSLVRKSINLTFPVYGHNSFQVLVLAIFNAYATAIANNLIHSTSDPESKSEVDDIVFKKFYGNFKNYITPTININDLQSKAKDK